MVSAPRPPKIYRPSFTSRLLHASSRDTVIGQATGFVVAYKGRHYLVSNWHVLSGISPVTRIILDSHCRVPDAVRISHLRASRETDFIDRLEPLYDEQGPLWLEHPRHGDRVDVAALPLTQLDDVNLCVHDPWMGMYIQIGVGDDLSIVGFPFGVQSSGLAIWTRAYVASEFEVDYNDLPCYLVDARTRKGQSGSPAVFFRTGAYFGKFGDLHMGSMSPEHVPTPGRPIPADQATPERGFTEQFLGIYSGRINEESDLGLIWRPSAICEVIEGGVRSQGVSPT